jgi:hypothetical protein
MNGEKTKKNLLQKISSISLGILLGVFSLSGLVFAQERDFTFDVRTLSTEGQEQGYLENASEGNPLAAFIIQIINFIVLISGSVSFLLIVVGGFMILSSAGNETSLNKGKDIIKIAIIGLVLTLSSYFIVAFVQSILFGV